jgi:NAD(P)-dependent dehydrogenase (short-subunit alcohol dehydrogenase family)
MASFADKVAVVTGGASGIGRALGEELARRGARVVLADINEVLAEQAAQAIRAAGGQASSAAVDVTDASAVQQMVDRTIDSHGAIDYMFNNAGIATVGEVLDLDLSDWERIIAVNLRGVVHGVQAVYPLMATRGSGHIINTASVAGLVGTPALVPYCTTKHAVVGLSRALRAEARRHGVRVSAACPGFVDTPIANNATVINYDRDAINRTIPFHYSAAQCARDVLRGVEQNRAEIVVTRHGRAMARLQRFVPRLMEELLAYQARRFESLRIKVANGGRSDVKGFHRNARAD